MQRRKFTALVGAFPFAGWTMVRDESPMEATDPTPSEQQPAGMRSATHHSGDEPRSTDERATTADGKTEALSFEGSGSALTEPFDLAEGSTMVDITYRGEGTFIAELIDDDHGRVVATLADTQGDYTARETWTLSAGTYVLDLRADGAWTVEIEQSQP